MSVKLKQNTVNEPIRLDGVPENSLWLAGEGAGSWFHIDALNEQYLITRYNPKGKIECSGLFDIVNHVSFDINMPYLFTHLSHCKSVKITQNEKVVKMERIL